jgi:hypothetical protein
VIAPVTVMAAVLTLLFDVGDFPVGRDFAVVTGHATATERCESQEPNQTHHDASLTPTLSNSCTGKIGFSARLRS